MEVVAFYFFAALAVGSALFILLTKNLMYAAFGLFLTFLGVAAMYVFAMADFLAVSQIMVYVGGVLVLLVFGIMLTRPEKNESSTAANYVAVKSKGVFVGGAVAIGFLYLLLRVILSADFVLADTTQISQKSTIQQLGIHLMTTHLLPFEIMAVLLLAVLIGAGYIAFNRIKQL
jgi:NADH:ubiquinone oxidoreductase subunit 6 (subunit J)